MHLAANHHVDNLLDLSPPPSPATRHANDNCERTTTWDLAFLSSLLLSSFPTLLATDRAAYLFCALAAIYFPQGTHAAVTTTGPILLSRAIIALENWIKLLEPSLSKSIKLTVHHATAQSPSRTNLTRCSPQSLPIYATPLYSTLDHPHPLLGNPTGSALGVIGR